MSSLSIVVFKVSVQALFRHRYRFKINGLAPVSKKTWNDTHPYSLFHPTVPQLSPAQSSVSLPLFSTCIAIFLCLSTVFLCLTCFSHLSALSVERQTVYHWECTGLIGSVESRGWLKSHAFGLCVSSSTNHYCKDSKSCAAPPGKIKAPCQVLNNKLLFWLAVRFWMGRLLGPDPDRGPPVSDLWCRMNGDLL